MLFLGQAALIGDLLSAQSLSGGYRSVLAIRLVPFAFPAFLSSGAPALPGGRRYQPGVKPLVVAQSRQFLEQDEADRLKDVDRLLRRHALADWDRVNQALVAAYQSLPRRAVIRKTSFHQFPVASLD